jgi:hypothetical protein
MLSRGGPRSPWLTAERSRSGWLRGRGPHSGQPIVAAPEFTIRHAHDGDAEALLALADLDSRSVPGGPLLVAVVDDELWAAVQIDGRAVIADPFRLTAELVALLQTRADHLRAGSSRRQLERAPVVTRLPHAEC